MPYRLVERVARTQAGQFVGLLVYTVSMATSTAGADLVGQILLDRYRLERRLARGGMADVYAAVDLRLRRPVAVKILHLHLADDPAFVTRFQREVRATSALAHPNVVRTYSGGEHQGRPFLVMELVDGESLAERLRRTGPLPLADALAVTCDVLSALAYAHGHGLVHRDVKPQNVLLAAGGRAKLADFGIAQSVEAAASTALTSAGQVLGSLAYLAPERLAGRPANPAADLYSVGAMLYQLLTGRLPFDADLPAALAGQHWQRAPQPPSALRPEVPPWLDQVILRALAKNPAARFSSAAAMQQRLEEGWAAHDATTSVIRAAAPAAGRVATAPTVAAAPRQVTRRMTSVPEATATYPAAGDAAGHPFRSPHRGQPRAPSRRLLRPLPIVWGLAFLALVVGGALAWVGRQSLVSPEADVATPPLGAAATALLSAPAPSPTLSAATPAPAASTSEVSTPEVPPAVAPTPASGGATATVIPTPDARQRVALVRALLQSASGVKGNVRQDFTQQLDDLQQKMAAGKTREARDRAQQLLRRTTDAARKRDLDPSLAAQMAAQLQALAGQLG